LIDSRNGINLIQQPNINISNTYYNYNNFPNNNQPVNGLQGFNNNGGNPYSQFNNGMNQNQFNNVMNQNQNQNQYMNNNNNNNNQFQNQNNNQFYNQQMQVQPIQQTTIKTFDTSYFNQNLNCNSSSSSSLSQTMKPISSINMGTFDLYNGNKAPQQSSTFFDVSNVNGISVNQNYRQNGNEVKKPDPFQNLVTFK